MLAILAAGSSLLRLEAMIVRTLCRIAIALSASAFVAWPQVAGADGPATFQLDYHPPLGCPPRSNLLAQILARSDSIREVDARPSRRFELSVISHEGVHFSVQRDQLHLLAEANDRRALSRGMQGLSIRVAKAVNRRLGRSGRVFADRYHARALKTPRETRWALRYVLSNARKHGRDLPSGFVDGCSSAPWFRGWARPSALAFVASKRQRDSDAPVMEPTTWLLRAGYRRAGPIDVDDAPVRAAPR